MCRAGGRATLGLNILDLTVVVDLIVLIVVVVEKLGCDMLGAATK
jgi:hypothetical protein